MKITTDLLKEKRVAGRDADGKPVVMVETHGGLFAFFRKASGGGYETVAAAPHRAVAAWMCEVKCPGMTWEKDFHQDLTKSDERFGQLRAAIFAPPSKLAKSADCSYLAYDVGTGEVSVVDRAHLVAGIRSGEVTDDVVVRRTDLSDLPTVARYHPDLRTAAW